MQHYETVKNAYKDVEKARYELWKLLDMFQSVMPGISDDFSVQWKDDVIGRSTAEILPNGIVKLHIPEYVPKLKELSSGSDYRQRWLEYTRRALAQLPEKPMFKKAHVIVEMHQPSKSKDNWDADNRAVIVIINSLKGILFPNDTCDCVSYEMTPTIVGSNEKECYVNIYIMDFNLYHDAVYSKLLGISII